MARNRTPKNFDPFSADPQALRDDYVTSELMDWAVAQSTTPREKAVLVAIAYRTPATLSQVAEVCCITETAASEAVRELVWEELVFVTDTKQLAVAAAAA